MGFTLKKGVEFHRIQASKNTVFGDLSEDLILLIADFGRFPFLRRYTAFAAKPGQPGFRIKIPGTVERDPKKCSFHRILHTIYL